MARLPKKGLLYFNIDCEQEDNLNFIEAKHGIVGYGVVVKLWKKIYQFQGYYCEWNERNIYLFAREVNVDISTVQDVVETCFEEKIYSRQLFNEYQILTSPGIQKRWKKIVTEAKRKDVEIDARFSLLPASSETIVITPEETMKIPVGMTQRKENEIKADEKILIRRGEEPAAPSEHGVIEMEKSDLKDDKARFENKHNETRRPADFHRPSSLESQNYFIKNTSHVWDQAMARSQSDLFISYYEANGWVQNNSKPIVNWKAAASGWILRELNGDFKIWGVPQPSKSNQSKAPATIDFKADIEHLYVAFLEGSLKHEHIGTWYYDYLKKENLIQFSDNTILEIRCKAREKRMQALLGTNQAELTRIYQAYEKGLTPTSPDIKKDLHVYNKVARRLAVLAFFEQLRNQNRSSVFN